MTLAYLRDTRSVHCPSFRLVFLFIKSWFERVHFYWFIELKKKGVAKVRLYLKKCKVSKVVHKLNKLINNFCPTTHPNER